MLPILAGIPILDAIVTVGSLIAPPAFDFLKKKFVKESNDTPERTMGTLAMTKPEVLVPYVEALAKHMGAKVQFFNRDVIGEPSQWIVNLRAGIRPITVIASLALLASSLWLPEFFKLDPGIRLFCESTVSSWMGSRLVRN